MTSWLRVLLPRLLNRAKGTRLDLRLLVGANDPLTRLPGPNAFDNTLEQAARQADAKREKLAVLLVNIDNFKSINSKFGGRAGDHVLRLVAKRLRPLVQPFMAARLEGDGFALLITGNAQSDDAAALAAQVLSEIRLPIGVVRGQTVKLTCAVGVAMYPDCGPVESMIPRARVAMANAKAAGGDRYSFFDPSMTQGSADQIELLRDLRRAVELKQLELHYQPKIHAPTGEITGAEALLRWKHPTRGLIGPGSFIPLAERSGLIIPIGHWIIDEASRQLRAWRDQGIRMRVAINLSAQQLRQSDLPEYIAAALRAGQVNPELLTCEVTETRCV